MSITKKTSRIVSSKEGFEIQHTGNQCNLLVILLHGYGSSGDDLISLVPYLEEGLPDAHWFAPNGVQRMQGFGYKWFDYDTDNIEKMQQGVLSCRKPILELIDKKCSSLELSENQVCIVGFSQGGMVAIDLALSSVKPFACSISFSGAFIYGIEKALTNIQTPLCLIHGKKDEVVPFSCLDVSVNQLSALGCKVKSHAIDNLAHSIDFSGLKIAKDFLLQNVK